MKSDTTLSNVREIPGSRDLLEPWLRRVVPPFGVYSPRGMLELLEKHHPGTRRAIDAVEETLSECPRREVIMHGVWERVLILHTIMVDYTNASFWVDPEEELRGAIEDVLQHYLEEEESLSKANEALGNAGSFHEA